jgi:hypothetical protein
LIDHDEGPRGPLTGAQRDQIVRAHHVLDRIHHQGAVVSRRNSDALAEHLLRLHPEAIVEHIAVAEDDDIDVLGLFDLGGKGTGILRCVGAIGRRRLGGAAGAPAGKAVFAGPVTRAPTTNLAPVGWKRRSRSLGF